MSSGASIYLDFVRVLATNMVVVEHLGHIFELKKTPRTGGAGVVLFFLLSGFLISLTATRRLSAARPQFIPFMLDRACRLLVPFVPTLVAVAVINAAVPLAARGASLGNNRGPAAFLGNLLLLNDYPVLQALSHIVAPGRAYIRSYNTAEPFWTIPIEFWIYAMFSLLFFTYIAGERIALSLRAPLLALGLPVLLWNSFAGGSGDLVLVWLVGAAFAYLWFTRLAVARNRPQLGRIAVAFGLLGFLGRIAKVGYHAYEFQQNVFVALMMFGILCCMPNVLEEGRGSVFIKWLASYSYSLYLVHNTLIVLIYEHAPHVFGSRAPAVAFLASHALAYLWYLAFERHYSTVARWLHRKTSLSSDAVRDVPAVRMVGREADLR